MHYLETETERKTKKKCTKSRTQKDPTRGPRIIGVQSGVTKSNGLYTCVPVPM